MKIAIQGHLTRGREVIQILESLGGKNCSNLYGRTFDQYYFINSNGDIDLNLKIHLLTHKLYTLEEFEKEFPFKIGDKVRHITSTDTIRKYCYIDNKPGYEVESMELGIIANIPAEILKPYKEMKERTVTLSLEKAKEWYNKGGELKEVALQAYSEEELVKLPKTWEEFCINYPIQAEEAFIGTQSSQIRKYNDIFARRLVSDKNICPSEKSAEAHLALIQLEQLRNCWRQGWEPIWDVSQKYCIYFSHNEIGVRMCTNASRFLTFQTREMAEEFLKCFKNLIEQAKDLI